MHSSRMRTVHCSSRLLGRGGACLSACWDTHPPPGWAWRPPPQDQTPQLPPGCGPGDLQGMLGYPPPGLGLETPTPRPNPSISPWVWAWRPAMHAGIPPSPLPWTGRHVQKHYLRKLHLQAVTRMISSRMRAVRCSTHLLGGGST